MGCAAPDESMPQIRWIPSVLMFVVLKVTPLVLGGAYVAWVERSGRTAGEPDGWVVGGATVVALFLLGLGFRYVLKDRPLTGFDVLMVLALYIGGSASAVLKASWPVGAGFWILAFGAAMGLGAWQPGARAARR